MNTQGYAAIPRSILYSDAIDGQAKLVYVALSSFVGSDSDKAWPSLQRLCSVTGLSQSTMQRSLRRLRDADLISWQRKRNPDRTWAHTIYTLKQPVVTVTTG